MKAFECKMCGECCYGQGGINVNEEEINKIALFLNFFLTVSKHSDAETFDNQGLDF